VSWPKPIPGLVIRYSFLWSHEAEADREEGSKDRPCAIILARVDEEKKVKITVLPITHLPPDENAAVELPPHVKRRLGLDDDRSWVILSEVNEFAWPGPDLRTLPDRDVSTVAYGVLPPQFFDYLLERFLEYDQQTRTIRIKRTE
jgi:hypothetical protein